MNLWYRIYRKRGKFVLKNTISLFLETTKKGISFLFFSFFFLLLFFLFYEGNSFQQKEMFFLLVSLFFKKHCVLVIQKTKCFWYKLNGLCTLVISYSRYIEVLHAWCRLFVRYPEFPSLIKLSTHHSNMHRGHVFNWCFTSVIVYTSKKRTFPVNKVIYTPIEQYLLCCRLNINIFLGSIARVPE